MDQGQNDSVPVSPQKARSRPALTTFQPSARLPLTLHIAAEQTPEGDTMTPAQRVHQHHEGGGDSQGGRPFLSAFESSSPQEIRGYLRSEGLSK
jgi:hypothetical protein